MSVDIDIRYLTTPLVHGRRYEMSLMAYDDWLDECYDWSIISFSAKPTARQIISAKKLFYWKLRRQC